MKKAFLLLLISLGFLRVNGQEAPGRFYMSGNAGIQVTRGNVSAISSTSGIESSWRLDLAPTLGYFLSDYLMIGIQPGFGTGANRSSLSSVVFPAGETSTTLYSAEASFAFLAKYHMVISENFYLSPAAGIGYSILGNEVAINSQNESGYSLSYLSGGTRFIHLFIRPELQYYLSYRMGLSLAFDVAGFKHGKSLSAITSDLVSKEFYINLELKNWQMGIFWRL